MKKPKFSLKKSKMLFSKAQKILPGGVNSPVRAFKSVGGTPPFIVQAKGAYLFDADGNKYIDYVGSWGPMILGHAHPEVIGAIQKTALRGTSYGAPNLYEHELAQKIQRYFPSMQMMRLVNSGTEAVMGAIRLARAFTKKEKIIKFEGCYHGHSDYLLVKAGSGALTFGVPDSAGVPASFANQTLTAPYNNIEEVEKLFKLNKNEIAAVIVEPVVGNSGFIAPQNSFLTQLRNLCDREKSVLIFDEVMTGFRVSLGGAQKVYKVRPDLSTLGKVIGGGLPVGAFGGRKEIMQLLAPLGPVYQAGTLSGNPLAMQAGLKTIELLGRKGVFATISKNTQRLAQGLLKLSKKYSIPLQVPYLGAMMGIFFSDHPIHNLEEAKQSKIDLFKKFFHGMLEEGIYLPPSAYEACFVSAAHQEKEIEFTLKAADKVFSKLRSTLD